MTNGGFGGDRTKKQSFLGGSCVLLASALVTKIIGALFKLPLTNLLGGGGMGYFSCAYGLFLPVYALSITGLTTAVAKLTAERAALEDHAALRRILKLSLWSFSLMGMLGTGAILLLAKPFCRYVAENPDAYLSVLVLAPAILLGCVSAVFRGYYEGLRTMYPTGLSQLAEALTKLVCGLGLCRYALTHPAVVLRYLPPGTTPLAAASAAAVLGVTLSCTAGTLFLILRHVCIGDGIPALPRQKPSPVSDRALYRALFAVLIPVAAGSLITNLTNLIDLATGMHCLNTAIRKAPVSFAARFANDSAPDPAALANFIFGSFSGLAVTIFNLVPSLTNMFGKGAIPAIAAAHAERNRSAMQQDSAAAMLATGFLALPAGLGISVLAQPILQLLYPQRAAEILAAAPSLQCLGPGVIFLALTFPLFSMLQAVGHAPTTVQIMGVGVCCKLAGNLLLIPLPRIHIAGAALSTTLCYLVTFLLALYAYQKKTGVKLGIMLFLKPAYGGMLCAAAAAFSYSLLLGRLGNNLALPAAICMGGCVYLFAMWLMGIRLAALRGRT